MPRKTRKIKNPTNKNVSEEIDESNWRIEIYSEFGDDMRVRAHREQVTLQDSEFIKKSRKAKDAEAGAPDGDATDPANYPDATEPTQAVVDIDETTITNHTGTISVGGNTINISDVPEILEEMIETIAAEQRAAAKQAAIDAAVATASP